MYDVDGDGFPGFFGVLTTIVVGGELIPIKSDFSKADFRI